jgi:hypothetical protein
MIQFESLPIAVLQDDFEVLGNLSFCLLPDNTV